MSKKGVILSGAKLKNIFGFENIECKFNSGVNYIYGKNGAGKSSLTLSGLWACIKGIAEQGDKFISSRFRCIGKNGASGDMEYEFTDVGNGGKFVIRNHVTKAANKITFQAVEGNPLPDDFLDDFFNVSLLSARNFCRLSGVEQAIALGIDTSTFDENIKNLKEERRIENRIIKDSGVLEEVEKVKPVDIEALKRKKNEIANKLNALYSKNREHNQKLRNEYETARQAKMARKEKHEEVQEKAQARIDAAEGAMVTLVSLGYEGMEVRLWINALPKPEKFTTKEIKEPEYIEEMPDDAELKAVEAEIEAAYETNEKAKKYSDYLAKLSAIKVRQKTIADLNTKIEQEEKERTNYITGKKFPFSGMTTDENGCLLFKDRPINESYYSKGELEIIVAKLAASQNPLFKTRFIDEFGILDPDNQKKLVDDLIAEGFQVIVSIPGERVEHDNAIVLRDCKIVDETNNDERPELL
jgi:hypothetical protein